MSKRDSPLWVEIGLPQYRLDFQFGMLLHLIEQRGSAIGGRGVVAQKSHAFHQQFS
jgi:hypothetical protein